MGSQRGQRGWHGWHGITGTTWMVAPDHRRPEKVRLSLAGTGNRRYREIDYQAIILPTTNHSD